MKAIDIRDLAERQPFRPFAVRLSSGVSFSFREPRQFGAPRDYRLIVFFGDTEAVRIDTDSIVEVMEQ